MIRNVIFRNKQKQKKRGRWQRFGSEPSLAQPSPLVDLAWLLFILRRLAGPASGPGQHHPFSGFVFSQYVQLRYEGEYSEQTN